MATWKPSPNYSAGRGGQKVNKIVIHWIVGTLSTADAVFANRASGVSAHYGVEGSKVHQYVKDADTAWHAGNWNTNQTSIGIEHSAAPGRAPTASTYTTTINLIAGLCKKYGINPATGILPHSRFVATRCPGIGENGGVDIPRIIKGVKAKLATSSTPAPKPSIPTFPNWKKTTGTTKILVNGLSARSQPYTKAAVRGYFKIGSANFTGITRGTTVKQNGRTSNVWLRSQAGNWFSVVWTSHKGG